MDLEDTHEIIQFYQWKDGFTVFWAEIDWKLD